MVILYGQAWAVCEPVLGTEEYLGAISIELISSQREGLGVWRSRAWHMYSTMYIY